MLIKSSELTKGEKLLMERRRLGLTQSAMAKKMKVSLYVYRRWETDSVEDAPSVNIGRLTDYEQCYLMRKRSGNSLQETANKLQVCRWWLCQMERGEAPIDRLIKFWAA